MPQFQIGTVFYANPGKGYGFARSDEGVRIFFHVNGQSEPRLDTSWSYGFSRGIRLVLVNVNGQRKPLLPQIETRLALDVAPDPRGLKAVYWTLESDYLAAQAQLDPCFLVTRRLLAVRRGTWVPQLPITVFRGKLEQLMLEHPKAQDDHLRSTQSSTTACEYKFWILEPGGWKMCEDPRKPASWRSRVTARV